MRSMKQLSNGDAHSHRQLALVGGLRRSTRGARSRSPLEPARRHAPLVGRTAVHGPVRERLCPPPHHGWSPREPRVQIKRERGIACGDSRRRVSAGDDSNERHPFVVIAGASAIMSASALGHCLSLIVRIWNRRRTLREKSWLPVEAREILPSGGGTISFESVSGSKKEEFWKAISLPYEMTL